MAYYLFMKAIGGGKLSLFYNTTNLANVYNFISNTIEFDKPFQNFIDREEVREAIHVGNTTFSDGSEVYTHLMYDIPNSVAPWIEELLENYRILFYNGQLDLLVQYPPTVEFLNHLNFSGAEEYKKAKRNPWYVGDDVAGYVKYAGNLIEVQVRNAGHMVPADQPEWAYDLIWLFTRNKYFS